VELRIRATLAEARLADLKATLDDMREQRDHWQTMAQRLAITDQRPAATVLQSRQWWQRLAGFWAPFPGGSTARTYRRANSRRQCWSVAIRRKEPRLSIDFRREMPPVPIIPILVGDR
jgi:hypothetical protein